MTENSIFFNSNFACFLSTPSQQRQVWSEGTAARIWKSCDSSAFWKPDSLCLKNTNSLRWRFDKNVFKKFYFIFPVYADQVRRFRARWLLERFSCSVTARRFCRFSWFYNNPACSANSHDILKNAFGVCPLLMAKTVCSNLKIFMMKRELLKNVVQIHQPGIGNPGRFLYLIDYKNCRFAVKCINCVLWIKQNCIRPVLRRQFATALCYFDSFKSNWTMFGQRASRFPDDKSGTIHQYSSLQYFTAKILSKFAAARVREHSLM